MIDLSDTRVLTFDCYGTLVDWEAGIVAALRPVLDRAGVAVDDERLLALHGELEAAAEAGPYRPYRDVLGEVLRGLGDRLGFAPTEAERAAFGASVGEWPPFPDAPAGLAALKRRFKLAIVSNVDDDLFARSNERLGVGFDWIVTAQQVKSYKPAPAHFLAALDRIGLPPGQVLHVAQSLYHDHVPAKRLGLRTVWVNRRHGRAGPGATPPAEARPDLELPDLATLAQLAAGQP
jgi:2-haloacid dehalogenase